MRSRSTKPIASVIVQMTAIAKISTRARTGRFPARHRRTESILRSACVIAVIAGLCLPEEAHAAKRRPTGCDWIGGDFADPSTMIFRRGCYRGGVRRHLAKPVVHADEPPALLDRLDTRAPANYGANTRVSIGAGIERFEIVGGKIAYGLDGGARLWRVTLGTKESAMVAHSGFEVRVTETGPLYVVENDRTLWRAASDGSDHVFLDHEVADFQPVGDVVYVLGKDKRLWRLSADGKSRDPVDENVAAFQAVDASLVFVLGTDGALWRETGNFHNRTKVAQPVSAFEYVAAGDTTYVLAPNHVLWRQKGKDGPEQVDHDVAAFRTVDMNVAYVLATDGRLWQEQGDRSQALLVDGDLALKLGASAFQFAGSNDAGAQAIYVLDRKHELWAETMPARGAGK